MFLFILLGIQYVMSFLNSGKFVVISSLNILLPHSTCSFRKSVWHMLDLPIPPACLLICLSVFHLFISESASFWVRASADIQFSHYIAFLVFFLIFSMCLQWKATSVLWTQSTILQELEDLSQHVQSTCHVPEEKLIRTNQHWSVYSVNSKKERVFWTFKQNRSNHYNTEKINWLQTSPRGCWILQ